MTEQEQRTERVLRIAEDDLRRRVIELSPQIKAEVDTMTQMIRELVNLEREKLGLDKPRGAIDLYLNQHKSHPSDPDLTGVGRVAGRPYRAAAWLSGKEKIRIALLPRNAK